MEIGPLASIWAAVAATASVVVAWLVYRRQGKADLPVIEAKVTPREESWWEVTVTMTNRSDVVWRVTTVAVKKPRGAKLLACRSVTDNRGNLALPTDLDALGNAVPTILETAPAGSNGGRFHAMGSSDRHSEPFLLHIPSPIRSRMLSMRLSLASSEAAQRKRTIAIKRTLPAHASTAKA